MRLPACLALLFLASTLLACGGGDDRPKPAVFGAATGDIKVSGASTIQSGLRLVEQLQAGVTTISYAGRIENTKLDYLEAWFETPDKNLTLIINQVIEGPGRYTEFDPVTGNSIQVLIGAACAGGSGDVMSKDCHWHSTLFHVRSCTLTIDARSDTTLDGRVDCREVGANCLESYGTPQAPVTCSDGVAYTPIDVTASFHLTDPVAGAVVPSISFATPEPAS